MRDHVTLEESWAVVRDLDGLRPLVELITNRERSALEDISSNLSERGWAIAALSELARDEQNREVMRELQGIAPLLRLLSPASQTPPYIQELALKALRNICLDNGANQRLVREQGGLPDVLALLLQTDNHHLQLEAAGTLSVLSHDAEACVWLKEHATTLRQLLESPITPQHQPQLLASLFHIVKRLCQIDVNFRKQSMKDEALWHLTNRHAHALLESLASEAQSLRSFLDPANFNHFLPSKRFVPNLQRSRNEITGELIEGSSSPSSSTASASSSSHNGPDGHAGLRRSRSSSVREPSASHKRKRENAPESGGAPAAPPCPAPEPDITGAAAAAFARAGRPGPPAHVLVRRMRSNSAPIVKPQRPHQQAFKRTRTDEAASSTTGAAEQGQAANPILS